ncbi:ECM25 [Candida jiufengensis]|uniref:ECM25 n=1 Tax=Candida jiufengensis TaxID=497108 RepID=UPI002224A51C|nr:ECM25 [Candida jiufengensis]KAI5954328.1 ECM25 [Candida jiufengensis]
MDRIFYNSNIRDPITNFPIYIFDTSYLPSTELINYNEFIPTLMQILPTKPYVLVMFSSGLNKVSWVWGLKFIKNFMNNNNNLQNLIKIFTVHESWFIKSITSVIHNFQSTKQNIEHINNLLDSFTIESKKSSKTFQTVVIPCSNLSELSKFLNITNLKISLNIYKYDLQLENEINLKIKFNPTINPHVTLNSNNHPILYHHIYQLLNIIELNCCKTELIFYKPGKKVNIDILYQCILRNQLISINDWDLFCISGTFKRILSEIPHALISVNSIPLPIQDDFEYTQSTFNIIISSHRQSQETENYDQLLLQLFDIFNKLIVNESKTKHNITSITKCMSHCISQEVVSTDKSSILIIQRFMKNVLQYWDKLHTNHSYKSIQEIIKVERSNQTDFEKSYDISYDITYEDGSDSNDDDSRISFNTHSILNSNSNLAPDEGSEGTNSTDTECEESNPKLPPRPQTLEEEQPPKTPKRPKSSKELPSTPISLPKESSKTPSRLPKELPTLPQRSKLSVQEKEVTKSQPILVQSKETNQPSLTTSKSLTTNINNSSQEDKENIEESHSSTTILNQTNLKRQNEKPLNNVSNLQFLQYPPQKYHFTPTIPKSKNVVLEEEVEVAVNKKPVIRGRKVGQLAKLFEERNEGFKILNNL